MPERFQPIRQGLSTRLLLMTVAFALIMQVLVYLPSIASYRETYLDERLASAQLAALALEAAPGNAITRELEKELLTTAGVLAIILRKDDRFLMLGSDLVPEGDADADYDLRDVSLGTLISDSFTTLEHEGARVIRVRGEATIMKAKWVEITMREDKLYAALNDYSNNIFLLSLVVALLTGTLVYVTLNSLLVKPMKRIQHSIVHFRRKPEDLRARIKASRRRDEIGVVERELAHMQSDVRVSLVQTTKLAHLGEAVAKITHDLRNIIATAQLASDAMARHDNDPALAKASERLVKSLDRAIHLCETTMKYGKMSETAPAKETFVLTELIDDIAESLGLAEADVIYENKISPKVKAYGDPQHLYRIFLNLTRNALEAQQDLPEGRAAYIGFSVKQDRDGTTHIIITDHGMGFSEHARENLFKPFVSSSRKRGTGLGLATAKELLQAHGGLLNLVKSDENGTEFMVCLPGH